MPFCHAPWSNIDISPQGVIAPCCKFRLDQYSDTPCNIKIHSIEEYKNSAMLASVKNDFDENRWPAGCERCRIEEQNGVESKRQLDYDRWSHHYENHDRETWLTASIAFGNTCNLSCITCGPASSSRWQQEHRARYGIDVVPNHFYKKDFVDEFLKNSDGLVHLDIPGGEPFLSGIREQKEMLSKLIDSGRSQQISLHYTTNCTLFPDDQWWNLWENFKEIDMQLSIDGVGPHNEYIRYPSTWKDVEKNVVLYLQKEKILNNFRLSVSHTVSAYNIFYLPEFFDWCRSLALPRPWLGRVHQPVHMRPSIWPSEIKHQIISHLVNSEHTDCHTWAKLVEHTDDSEHYSKFLEAMQWHDQYRNLDFKTTFPEMARFI